MTQTINPADEARVREILIKVLGSGAYTHIRRLGGLTNRTYAVEMEHGEKVTVRLPGAGTQDLICRKDEAVSNKLACELGLDAPMLFFGEQGEKVMRYIPGAETMTARKLRQHDILELAAQLFRRLHCCGQDTGVPFQVFAMAEDYERLIENSGVALFGDYAPIKKRVMQIKEKVDRECPSRPVPCHNDPLCENWVRGADGRLYLIDWEYAGMNDGMWDLADLSVEAELDPEQDRFLLEAYLQHQPGEAELLRFHANKVYLDYLWSLWAKTRVPYAGEEMERYGLERYERMKKNLALYF